jgi:cob(I)alamin adenosyltransferase
MDEPSTPGAGRRAAPAEGDDQVRPCRAGLERGCVHVYTGDGKGKTTAALGLALRALGHGLRVFVVQFMKGNIEYGELEMARRLAPQLEVRQMGRETFVSKQNPDPIDIDYAQRALELSRKVLLAGEHDVVVLDEINVAADFGLIEVDEVMELIDERPKHVELVLTGRYASSRVIEVADLVTEMKMIKHYFDRGVGARVGIER